MSIFKRKPKCEHKWKAFPWVLQVTDEDPPERNPYKLWIEQSFVCVKCKRVKEEELNRINFASRSTRDSTAKDWSEMYKDRLQGAAEVQSAILEEQLVDHDYLDLMERAEAARKTELQIELEKLLNAKL